MTSVYLLRRKRRIRTKTRRKTAAEVADETLGWVTSKSPERFGPFLILDRDWSLDILNELCQVVGWKMVEGHAQWRLHMRFSGAAQTMYVVFSMDFWILLVNVGNLICKWWILFGKGWNRQSGLDILKHRHIGVLCLGCDAPQRNQGSHPFTRFTCFAAVSNVLVSDMFFFHTRQWIDSVRWWRRALKLDYP